MISLGNKDYKNTSKQCVVKPEGHNGVVIADSFIFSNFKQIYSFTRSNFTSQILIIILIFTGVLINSIWITQLGILESWSSSSANQRNIKKSVPTSALNVFQVYQPVFIPSGNNDIKYLSGISSESGEDAGNESSKTICQVTLMEHSFGNSYGKPFIGNYTPPSCNFNRVVINFTATCQGRQFDRLAIMYLNDTEVWRTSTAEPTKNGIVFEYIKDMSAYLSLWMVPQKIIFDLGNLIDETYTGPFNTSLTATFFTYHEMSKPADKIIPVSARRSNSNSPSVFSLPSDKAINSIIIPQNANRAVFTLSVCGQANEEFWWSNVLQSDTQTFRNTNDSLFGYSPFREVQILVDGNLAGVHWPFTVIFTGGLAPGLWRPIVGIDSFDLREHEIDITPWLGTLSDGKPHNFEIRVVGIQDKNGESGTLSKKVGENWLVTGKIFLWLDSQHTSVTTGNSPDILVPDPVINVSHSITQNATGANDTLTYTTDVERTLSISSIISSEHGSRHVTWTQNLKATNYGHYESQGTIQVTNQTTSGIDMSSGDVFYKSTYSYPLWTKSSSIVNEKGDFISDSQVIRGLSINIDGSGVFPSGIESYTQSNEPSLLLSNLTTTLLDTTQCGTAHYISAKSSKTSLSYGSTTQEFSFYGSGNSSQIRELYFRNVTATNGTLTHDQERIVGIETSHTESSENVGDADLVFASHPSKDILGRTRSRI